MRIAVLTGGFGAAGLAATLAAGATCGGDDSGTPDATDVTDLTETADEGGTCTGGLTWCDGGCVDTNISPTHCGGCGNSCGAGHDCVAGHCTLRCPTLGDFEDCGGDVCANLDSDPHNCGSCGNACGAGEVCSCGECTSACSDLDADPANCGACGHACLATEECCCGECVDTCELTECTPPIPPLEPCVAGGCYDTRWDFYNCGRCGTVCSAGMRCGGGACTTDACVSGEEYCDGHCVNLNTDMSNCGRCGHACDREIESCVEGRCLRL